MICLEGGIWPWVEGCRPCSTVYVYQLLYIRQLVAQESVDNRIHVQYARTFCGRLASEFGVLDQSLDWALIELVLVSALKKKYIIGCDGITMQYTQHNAIA